jgi:hypothetical protein
MQGKIQIIGRVDLKPILKSLKKYDEIGEDGLTDKQLSKRFQYAESLYEIKKLMGDRIEYFFEKGLMTENQAVNMLKKLGEKYFTWEDLDEAIYKISGERVHTQPDWEEPKTKKSKKTIEVDEKGTIRPIGFTEKEKDIIRKIDHNIYTPETIIQIIKDIASKKVKSPKDFPKADYGESEEEEEEEEIPEEKPKKGTHGGFRVNAGRKKTEKPVEEIKEEPVKKEKEIPISVIKKKPGRKSKYTEAEKAKMAAKKAKAKERKRIANLKPYFKADEPTKGFREASMMEAADANKIMLWGKKKADAKVIKEQFDKGKTLKPKRLEMMSNIARKRGRLDRLKKEMEDPKISFKDKSDKATEYETLRKQLLVLYDEYKKMEDKAEPAETDETKHAKKPTKKSIKKTK